MTGNRDIDYEALAQDAMRGIVRRALQQVADLGYLPGEHHFYIAFDTRVPGVVLSKRLKQRYPEEMTIVLQHQFRDLEVGHDRFEVTLSFDNVLDRLTVPLRALRVFFDPSVPYGIQFESSDLVKNATAETAPRDADALEAGDRQSDTARRPGGPALAEPGEPAALPKPRSARKPRVARDEAGEAAPTAPMADGIAEITEPGGGSLQRRQPGRPKVVRPGLDHPVSPANDAKVVQLDTFRKR